MTILVQQRVRTASRHAIQRVIACPIALVLLLLMACTDQRDAPLSARGPGRVQLSVLPHLVQFGAEIGAPINRIRAIARDSLAKEILGTLVTEVDPEAAQWQVKLEVQLPGGAATNVVVTIELLHVEGNTETVEWSGVTTVAVSPGQAQPAATLLLYRGPPSNLTITAVRIARPVPEIVEGGSAALIASAEGSSGTPQIYWSSLDPTIAVVGPTGTVQGVLPGSARVVAVAGPRADTTTIVVTQRIASVQITPATANLASLGAVALFQARVLDPRGTQIAGAEVAWSVADPAIAEALGNGRFRARANGATTVTAASLTQPSIRGTAGLIVGQRVISVDLNPVDRTLISVGARQQFTAVARDADGNPVSDARITWSSSAPAVARIDPNGLATAVGEGRTTIRASTAGNPSAPGDSVSATTSLTVSLLIALVDVLPADDTLFAIGDTLRLVARAFDGGGAVVPGLTFNWTSSNQAVATVDARGKVTAVSVGAATIRAETGGVGGNATLHVIQTLTRIDVVPQYATVSALNQSVQFNASPRDRYNNLLPGRFPIWGSSNLSVATITETGLATARGFGTATINATIDGVTGQAEFTVRTGGRTVTVTPASATLNNRGDTIRLAATVRDSAGILVTNPVITWTTFDASVAGVTATGLVDARSPGAVTIMATSGGASGTSIVSVSSHASVVTVTVTPNNALVPVGRTLLLTASARDVQNNLIPGAPITWSSSDASRATVSTSGLVNGRAVGNVLITASSGGRIGTSSITVYAATAAALTKESGDLQSGTVSTPLPSPLVTRVTDVYGNPVSGQAVQWVVTGGGGNANPATATSDPDGLARTQLTLGASAGSNTIEARATGLTGSPVVFTATAMAAAVSTVTVAPATTTLTAGGTATLTATARDASNVILPNVVFSWSSSDTTIAHVDGTGLVTARRIGVATIRATAAGKTGTATVTVNTGPPAILAGWSGNGQAAVVLTALRDPLVVQVSDIAGNPVSGVTVQWVVTSGAGTPAPASSISGTDGLASTSWTLGPTIGTQTIEARATGLLGSPYVFTASASGGQGVRKTWVGGAATAPTDWSTVDNWMPAGVPIDRDTAYIPASAPNQPAINGNVRIGALIVQSGASLNTSGYQIEVLGSVEADGTITGPGSVLMTGMNVSVRGVVSNLSIAGTVTANGALTTTGSLSISTGNLTVNGQTLTVQGDFTAGGGTITMTNAADLLIVQGNAVFLNIDETGKLTNGAIRAAGDFVIQCYNDTEFVPTGTRLLMNGTAPQNLSMACSGDLRSRVFDLTIASGANVATSDNPIYIVSALKVSGNFTINSGALVDVAGPSGSVVINSGGVLNNNGTLKANLPITNNGTLNGNPVTQR